MTTAHRPTWNTAKGGSGKNEKDLSKLSQQYSSRDMPSEMKLKYRQPGQSTAPEIPTRKDLRRELTERERNARNKERGEGKDKGARDSSYSSSKKPRLDQITSGDLDADDPIEEESSSDSDNSDDEAELMAELARIKKERAAEKAKEDAKMAEQQERIRTENILRGNPLLSDQSTSKADFQVKRRWDDDVVFKNCAKGLDERAKKPVFINDAIRTEFHRKFMEKYIV